MKPTGVLAASGAVLILAGLIAVPLPGPGWPIMSLGATVLMVAGLLTLVTRFSVTRSKTRGRHQPK